MPVKPLQGVIHHLRRTVGVRGLREVPDAELLKRFTADRDEAAFELLVWRHGKMVFNVCRRICLDGHDAEDAFQAAFLALVRKAGSISKHESVGGWLYKVAYRVAQTARVRTARRTGRVQAADLESVAGSTDPASNAAWREVRLLIDDELHRLPEKYRLPFVLCHLEGHSNADAARELGCAVGTVESRLTRARQRLRTGLARRGVTLSAGLTVALLARHAAAACVRAELVVRTAKAAMFATAGHAAAGFISAKVAALTEGVLKTMFITKLKTAAAVLLAVGALAAGAGGWTYHAMAATTAADDDSSKITTKDADADRIAKLIERLGSDTFAEREAATRDLERLGVAAADALRKAAQSSDVETRRRAEALVKKIEKELSSRELLQAKNVRLRFKDTPLPEAVAELAKQSGYEIVLDDPDGKLKERKVTLDTDDMPFWRAVDRLCRAGGVVEADADGPMGMPMFRGGVGAGMPNLPPGVVGKMPGAGMPRMPLLPGNGPAAPAPAGGALPPPGAKAPPAAPIGPAPVPDLKPPKAAPDAQPPKEAGAQAVPPVGGDAPPTAPPGGQIAPATGTQPAGKALPAAAPPAPPAGGWAVRQIGIAGPGGPPAGFVLRAPPAVAGINTLLANNKLVLKDGKAAISPTAYVGAARIRAVSDANRNPAPPARDGESNVGLQISLEPKLMWRRLTALRLDKAVDDQGQTLEEAAAADSAPAAGAGGIGAPGIGGRRAGGFGGPGGGMGFVVALNGDAAFAGRVSLYTPLRLKKGEKPAKLLKELKCTLTAEVFGPIKPIITVGNLLKAAGKTFKGDDGASLEVLDIVKGNDDQITMKLALVPPADGTPGIAAVGGVGFDVALPPAAAAPGGALPPAAPAAKVPPPPAAPAAGAIVMSASANSQQSEVSLIDAQGKAVQTTRHIVSYRGSDKGFTHMHEFAFKLPKDQDTIKLVFSGRRPATIEVPFTLKDVPLP